MAFRLGRKKWLVLTIVVAVAAVAAKVVTLVRFGPPVTISKETTYITEPLRPDGFPDYIGALNQRFSEGVTTENNSAVLFWRTMGPSAIEQKYRERYFQMLGIPPLPEEGDYFITSSDHEETYIARQTVKEQPPDSPFFEQDELLEQDDPFGVTFEQKLRWQLHDQFELVQNRPWSKQEFPVWAEWVVTNEQPLTLLVEATKRPRRYDPLIGETVIGTMLPSLQHSRDIARALIARAMFRLHEEKTDEAWQDLLACHRLARLIGQGPTSVDALVAITIDRMALTGDLVLLEYGKPIFAQIAAIRKDLVELPPMPRMVDKTAMYERFVFLDCVVIMARQGLGDLVELTETPNANKESVFKSLMDTIGKKAMDWDIILRMGNSWYDRLVAGMRKPTRVERKAAAAMIDTDLKKLSASVMDLKSFAWSFFCDPPKTVSERTGQVLVALLLPAHSAASKAQDRATMRFELTNLAFALAAYRADHGAYPAKLDELVPKYVNAIPKDIFNNDADLHYTKQDNGYLLYSVGSNGKDDGGKDRDDCKESEDWDDLVVRIPSKPEQ